ncbi:nucleotidyltransferase family protein [Tellurirhabdus rosea]|uniref:nucleotidyltransferase family protein n=1 Tax=Tellurirhabdus rosea TaxID=2674997 RepID=UPI0022552806|nr:nucleotidyltransferase domain-containing protein [Tellurirhabdus rosea]
MQRAEILQTLALPQLREEFVTSRIGLFGSYARNEATDRSDIDLVYELAEGYTLGDWLSERCAGRPVVMSANQNQANSYFCHRVFFSNNR